MRACATWGDDCAVDGGGEASWGWHFRWVGISSMPYPAAAAVDVVEWAVAGIRRGYPDRVVMWRIMQRCQLVVTNTLVDRPHDDDLPVFSLQFPVHSGIAAGVDVVGVGGFAGAPNEAAENVFARGYVGVLADAAAAVEQVDVVMDEVVDQLLSHICGVSGGLFVGREGHRGKEGVSRRMCT